MLARMKYRVMERAYGPDIRGGDWKTTGGQSACAGGELHLLADDTPTAVTRQDYPYGGGGDVALHLTFAFDRLDSDGQLVTHFNHQPRQSQPHGFQIVCDAHQIICRLQDRECARRPAPPWQRDEAHTLTLATLAESFVVLFDGAVLAEGQLPPPFTDNEGWTSVQVQRAQVRLMAFEEQWIAHDLPCPAWRKTECLFDDTAVREPLEQRWLWNGPAPLPTERGWTFTPLSVATLRPRFEGPLAVEFHATPEPTDRFSAGVTDAIFIWMMDRPEGEVLAYLAALPNAELTHYLPLAFYWMDFGGSNNVTTRLRKHPSRHLIRQFTDRARLLERRRTYAITLAQHGHWAEFWVDGRPWIQAFDPHPCQAGHIAFRAFVAALTIRDLKIWSIVP